VHARARFAACRYAPSARHSEESPRDAAAPRMPQSQRGLTGCGRTVHFRGADLNSSRVARSGPREVRHTLRLIIRGFRGSCVPMLCIGEPLKPYAEFFPTPLVLRPGNL
jgi:hypothetical protein